MKLSTLFSLLSVVGMSYAASSTTATKKVTAQATTKAAPTTNVKSNPDCDLLKEIFKDYKWNTDSSSCCSMDQISCDKDNKIESM